MFLIDCAQITLNSFKNNTFYKPLDEILFICFALNDTLFLNTNYMQTYLWIQKKIYDYWCFRLWFVHKIIEFCIRCHLSFDQCVCGNSCKLNIIMDVITRMIKFMIDKVLIHFAFHRKYFLRKQSQMAKRNLRIINHKAHYVYI